jgi:hypothetical protein
LHGGDHPDKSADEYDDWNRVVSDAYHLLVNVSGIFLCVMNISKHPPHQGAIPAEMREKDAASFPYDRKEYKAAVINNSGICFRHARGYRK